MKFKINISTPDNGEKFAVERSNARLTTIAGYQAKDADLTITIDRRELEDVMVGSAKLAGKVAAGKARLEGNAQVLTQLGSTMVQFDNWFEVLPGTKKESERCRSPSSWRMTRPTMRDHRRFCDRLIVR